MHGTVAGQASGGMLLQMFLTASAEELQRRISQFMLRRTAGINEQHLPQCFQYVVFCKPTASQLSAPRTEVYGEDVVNRSGVPALLKKLFDGRSGGVDGSQVLSVISRLRQICNHARFYPVVRFSSFSASSRKTAKCLRTCAFTLLQ